MASESLAQRIVNEGMFAKELERLLNKYSFDAACKSPNYILAQSVVSHLSGLAITIRRRENWFGDNDIEKGPKQ